MYEFWCSIKNAKASWAILFSFLLFKFLTLTSLYCNYYYFFFSENQRKNKRNAKCVARKSVWRINVTGTLSPREQEVSSLLRRLWQASKWHDFQYLRLLVKHAVHPSDVPSLVSLGLAPPIEPVSFDKPSIVIVIYRF